MLVLLLLQEDLWMAARMLSHASRVEWGGPTADDVEIVAGVADAAAACSEEGAARGGLHDTFLSLGGSFCFLVLLTGHFMENNLACCCCC